MTKPPKRKTDPRAAVIPASVLREREWAYGLWMGRRSWDDMRRLAALSPADGGLGYDLSLSALKGLVEGAKADRGELGMSRSDRVERQTYETDERVRAAVADLRRARERAEKIELAIAEFDVHGITDLAELAALGRLSEARDKMAREIEAAERRMDAAQEREAKLHGLNAAAEANINVTHHKDVADELNAMLGLAGIVSESAPSPEGAAP